MIMIKIHILYISIIFFPDNLTVLTYQRHVIKNRERICQSSGQFPCLKKTKQNPKIDKFPLLKKYLKISIFNIENSIKIIFFHS